MNKRAVIFNILVHFNFIIDFVKTKQKTIAC